MRDKILEWILEKRYSVVDLLVVMVLVSLMRLIF